MIAQIDFELKKDGYHYISVKPKEAGVYYKVEGSSVYAVVGIADHKDFVTNAKQLEAVLKRVRELFLDSSKQLEGFLGEVDITQVFLQMLIITQRSSYYKEMAQQVRGIWIVDTQENNLVIYENQPGNFFGLKEKVEKILFSDLNAANSNDETKENKKTKNFGWNEVFSLKKRWAVITIFMIAVNSIVFFITSFMGDTTNAQFLYEHGGLYLPSVIINREWYRLFSSMFLHSGFLHLLNNMFILYFTGEILELAVGKIRYVIIYLIAGIGGGLLSLFVAYKTGLYVVSVGASGAIFGVIGGLLWVVIAHRGKYKELTSHRMLIMIILIVFAGFTSTQTDNWGHIGGLVTGFLSSVLLYHPKKSRSW